MIKKRATSKKMNNKKNKSKLALMSYQKLNYHTKLLKVNSSVDGITQASYFELREDLS